MKNLGDQILHFSNQKNEEMENLGDQILHFSIFALLCVIPGYFAKTAKKC